MPPEIAANAAFVDSVSVLPPSLSDDVARAVLDRARRLLRSGEVSEAEKAERLAELPGAGASRLSQFDVRKRDAERLADLFRRAGRADLFLKVHGCAPWLKMSRPSRSERWRAETVSCSVRECPMCNSRDAAKRAARLSQALALVQSRNPSARWLFVTLTVRNCPIGELRETVRLLNASWQRFVQRREFSRSFGWSRSVEVTRSKDGSAHPHIHALIAVPASYFSTGYVPHARWVSIWRECLRADYDPSVVVKAVKKPQGDEAGLGVSSGMISELTKAAGYSLKPSDVEDDPQWMVDLHEQQSKLRFFSTGGQVKAALKELGFADEDEDRGDGVASEDVLSKLLFRWHQMQGEYRRRR